MAKRRIYTLTEDSMRELSQTLYQLRNEVEELRYRLNGRAQPTMTRQLSVGKTTAAGTALSGSTPGSVAVDIYARNSSGVLTVQESITAYVLLSSALASGKWILVERDRLGDYYVIDTSSTGTSTDNLRLAYTGGSGIPARSGTTAGSGTVSLVTQSGATLTTTGTTVTAYNLSASAVAANVYVQLKKDSNSGLWHVDFEDCG